MAPLRACVFDALGRSGFVAIVVADPGHGLREAGFVAAFGREVEEVVGAEEHVQAASVGRVGVEDFAGFVFVENAEAGIFFAQGLALDIVVFAVALGVFVFGEGNGVVEVEIVLIG